MFLDTIDHIKIAAAQRTNLNYQHFPASDKTGEAGASIQRMIIAMWLSITEMPQRAVVEGIYWT
jgi:hypothetical protein